jgi:hypothetical protein
VRLPALPIPSVSADTKAPLRTFKRSVVIVNFPPFPSARTRFPALSLFLSGSKLTPALMLVA